jgi:hypothetical protein
VYLAVGSGQSRTWKQIVKGLNGTLGKLKALFMQGFWEISLGEDEEYAQVDVAFIQAIAKYRKR